MKLCDFLALLPEFNSHLSKTLPCFCTLPNVARNFVIVSVNGRSFKIMKGVQVEVPDYVAEVLENSRMMAETARRYVDERAN